MWRASDNKTNKAKFAWILCGALWFCTFSVHAKSEAPVARAAEIGLAELPPQGRETYSLIQRGGPFPYEKDGTVFGNRERQLPGKFRGYYREYTVKTPGVRHRGARRIVCGGEVRHKPDVCYYTSDHYASFRRIAESVH